MAIMIINKWDAANANAWMSACGLSLQLFENGMLADTEGGCLIYVLFGEEESCADDTGIQ